MKGRELQEPTTEIGIRIEGILLVLAVIGALIGVLTT